MKRLLIAVIVLVVVGFAGWQFRWKVRDMVISARSVSLPPAIPYARPLSDTVGDGSLRGAERRSNPVNQEENSLQTETPPPSSVATPPVAVNLAVPFTSQAPHANWDAVHEETCEEASVLMVRAFFDGRGLGGPDGVERELQKMVAWQRGKFGYFEDTNVEETAVMIRELYGYTRVEVVYEVTADDIRRRLAEGVPVILPLYGRALGNPFYTPPGPDYHMLVVRGYTADGKFITNDPGTRRGEAYLYRSEVLVGAIHDWNAGNVERGRRAMIVVYPN